MKSIFIKIHTISSEEQGLPILNLFQGFVMIVLIDFLHKVFHIINHFLYYKIETKLCIRIMSQFRDDF